MLKKIFLAAAFFCGVANCAYADNHLRLEKEYHSDCLPLFEEVHLDGSYVYHTKGSGENNYFSKLNLLNGECTKVAELPTMHFHAQLASDKYLLAHDGIYNRYSIYIKPDWKRYGSIRLKDNIVSGHIIDHKLYLLQNSSERKLYLNTFSLPALQLVGTVPVELPDAKAQMFDSNFVLYDNGHLISYAYDGTKISQATLPAMFGGIIHSPSGQAVNISCGSEIQKLNDRYVMVRTGCGVYTVFDLQNFQKRYDIQLPPDVTFAEGMLLGDVLYLFEQAPEDSFYHQSAHHTDIRVLNFKDGKELHRLQALEYEDYKHTFQIDGRLIIAAYERKAHDFHVQIFKLDDASIQ
jgi:hypothetical protein